MDTFLGEAAFRREPHAILKNKLLEGTIALEDFLRAVFDLDQSTDDRTNAMNNLSMLEEPEVKNVFEHSEYKDEYYAGLGFAAFHSAQILAKSGALGVVKLLDKSLKYIKEIVDQTMHPVELWYVEGTIAYMNSDIPSLKEIIEKYKNDSGNIDVLQRLLDGLEKRGHPDYNKDY